ncbi:MAG: hemolysin family protein [Nitriliruptoraceae bacterium]
MSLIVFGVGLMGVFALAAAMDTVLERLERVRVLRLVEEDGGFGTDALLWLFEHRARARDTLLAVRLVAAISIAGLVVYVTFGQAVTLGRLAGVMAATAAGLILVDVVARLMALTNRETLGRRFAPLTVALVRLFTPVAVISVGLGRLALRAAGDLSSPNASDEELNRLALDDEATSEEIEPEERAMIRSIFELGDRRVREIMVPRPDMVAASSDATVAAVLNLIIDAGFSRLPVHDVDDNDRIVGVVYAKDLLAKIANDSSFSAWHTLLRSPTFVPETKRVDDLLRELQAGTVHLVFVVDEYGELVGLVTIEDILEEIVGEIVDEYDQQIELSEPLGDNRWRIDGRMTVSDFNEHFMLDLPVDEGYDTVGGMVFAMLGELPSGGEQLDVDLLSITVEQVQGRRIGAVIVEPRDDTAANDTATNGATDL